MAGYIGSKAVSVNTTSATISDDLSVGDDLTVTDDATIGGTLAVTGVVTANAGVVVDNITIDGQEIDVSSGDLTLDVAGDILLNADGGDIFLADDSVTFGKLKNSSSHFFIQSLVADKDILIIGNDSDGGGEVTAVEFDMSDAGTAKFSHDATFVDNAIIKMGTDSDLKISHSGSAATINNNTGDLSIQSDGNLKLERKDGGEDYIHCIQDGAVELHHNGTQTFETTATGIAVTDGTVSLPAMSFKSDANTGMYRIGSDVLGFSTAGTERVRIDSTGIAFHGDTATANHLNDYEEGTWTPLLRGTGGVSGQSYSSATGTYTKVGRTLVASFTVALADKGSMSGDCIVAGLPFTSISGSTGGGVVGFINNTGVTITDVTINGATGQAYVFLQYINQGTTYVNNLNILTDNTRVDGVITVQVA